MKPFNVDWRAFLLSAFVLSLVEVFKAASTPAIALKIKIVYLGSN